MKRFNLVFSIVMVITMVITSCQDETFVESQTVVTENMDNGIVYPLSKKAQTRALSAFDTDWENQISVILNSGEPVNLPWCNSNANLPVQFCYDVKKEDGWILLLHTLSNTSITSEDDINYMILYNQRTGMLKIFYYLEDNIINNGGVWTLNFSYLTHQLFNHTGFLAQPMDINHANNYSSTNASTKADASFRRGWNGFQVQLAYDDSNNFSDAKLSIETECTNTWDVNLYGDFVGYSDGTLITHGSSNPITSLNNDIASVFGNEAQEFIENEFKPDDDPSTKSLLSGIAGAIVGWGVNKILGAITAGFSQPTMTTTDLSFTTKTNGTISGDFNFNGNSPATTFRPNFSTDDIGCHLGVWNLATTPTVYVDPRANIIPESKMGNDYYYRLGGITGYDYDLRINPDLEDYIVNKWVEIEMVRYQSSNIIIENPVQNFNYGSIGNGQNVSTGFADNDNYRTLTPFYTGTDEEGDTYQLYDDDMKAACYMREGLRQKYGNKTLQTIFLPKETYNMAGEPEYNMSNRFMKFSLYLVTEFEGKRDTTLFTRTFAPKVEWDPDLYDQYEDYPFENTALENALSAEEEAAEEGETESGIEGGEEVVESEGEWVEETAEENMAQ